MALLVSPTEDDVYVALRAVLVGVLPTGTEVRQTQVNRVPEPKALNFVLMTQVMRRRLATNLAAMNFDGDQRSMKQAVSVTVQLDFHGDAGADNAQVISTIMRDDYGVALFDAYPGITPLHGDDPRQMPFMNTEKQYEDRWIMQLELQVDQTVIAPQASADTLTIDSVVPVDVVYPAQ